MINMIIKYTVYMHITAELKNLLAYLFYLYIQ